MRSLYLAILISMLFVANSAFGQKRRLKAELKRLYNITFTDTVRYQIDTIFVKSEKSKAVSDSVNTELLAKPDSVAQQVIRPIDLQLVWSEKPAELDSKYLAQLKRLGALSIYRKRSRYYSVYTNFNRLEDAIEGYNNNTRNFRNLVLLTDYNSVKKGKCDVVTCQDTVREVSYKNPTNRQWYDYYNMKYAKQSFQLRQIAARNTYAIDQLNRNVISLLKNDSAIAKNQIDNLENAHRLHLLENVIEALYELKRSIAQSGLRIYRKKDDQALPITINLTSREK